MIRSKFYGYVKLQTLHRSDMKVVMNCYTIQLTLLSKIHNSCPVLHWSLVFSHFCHICQFTVPSDARSFVSLLFPTSFHGFLFSFSLASSRSVFASANCYPPCVTHVLAILTCYFPLFPKLSYSHLLS